MSDTLQAELIRIPLRIINGDDRAENFAQIPGAPPFFTSITFNEDPGNKFQAWFIEHFDDDGYKIRNAGSDYWAAACGDQVKGTSEFDPKTCKWFIHQAGKNQYKILVPNVDSVWTAKSAEPGSPKTVFLEGADGSDAQLFRFRRATEE